MEARAYRWDELPVDHPMALLERRRVIGERMMVSQVLLRKGCDVPLHSHDNEQITVVVRGRLRFGLGGGAGAPLKEVVISEGEVLHLPSGIPHSAYAVEETLVLDLFSPPSEKTGIDRS